MIQKTPPNQSIINLGDNYMSKLSQGPIMLPMKKLEDQFWRSRFGKGLVRDGDTIMVQDIDCTPQVFSQGIDCFLIVTVYKPDQPIPTYQKLDIEAVHKLNGKLDNVNP
jgi:hypothetical protein